MPMRRTVDRDQTVKLFEDIRSSFPHLQMDLQLWHRHVEVWMEARRQPGLMFDVNLNLQGDELHLSAGVFWFEWFPSTNPEVIRKYRDAIDGLLSGKYRILEHYIGPRPVKAQLQEPDGAGWRTIATWCNLRALIPRRRT